MNSNSQSQRLLLTLLEQIRQQQHDRVGEIVLKATKSKTMDSVTLDEAKYLIERKIVVQHGRVCDRGDYVCIFCKAFGMNQTYSRRDSLKRHYSNHLNHQ